MVKERSRFLFLIYLSIIVLTVFTIYAGDIGDAPLNIQAAIFLKLLGFNKNFSGDVTIYVLGSGDFTSEMSKTVGKAIGSAKIGAVSSGNNLPDNKPSVLYVGDKSKADDAMNYCRSNKILSITGIPDLVEKGISLGVGIEDGKPKILLNITGSKEENINWNPAIMKIATTFK